MGRGGGQTDRRVSRQVDRWMDGHVDEWTER
jgi:hypothetical protein